MYGSASWHLQPTLCPSRRQASYKNIFDILDFSLDTCLGTCSNVVMSITELIEGLGMTDEALARRLCVSSSTVYRWRNGRKVPTPHIRKALCRLAGVFPSDVLWARNDAALAAERER